MASKIWRIFTASCALIAGFAALLSAVKIWAAGVAIDSILNVASNCGAESGAGGLGAGAGSAACGNESDSDYSSSTVVADNSLDLPGAGRHPQSNGWEEVQNYRNNMQSRTNSERRPAASQTENPSSNDPTKDSSSTKSREDGKFQPDSVKFPPEEKQEQA